MVQSWKHLPGHILVAGIARRALEYIRLFGRDLSIEGALQNQKRLPHFTDRDQRIVRPKFFYPGKPCLGRIF